MCRLALGMECCVAGSGTQQFDMPWERASWYVLRGSSVFYLKQPLVVWPPLCLRDHLIDSDGLFPHSSV